MSVTVNMDTQRSPFGLQHKDSWKVNGINIFNRAEYLSHHYRIPLCLIQVSRFLLLLVKIRDSVTTEFCVFNLRMVGNFQYT